MSDLNWYSSVILHDCLKNKVELRIDGFDSSLPIY